MTPFPRFMIAAAHESSCKTVIPTGLAAAFHKAGNSVATFKKGPDYIDPVWLSAASGAACYNLDFNAMGPDSNAELAKLLGLPVILVIDTIGMTRGIAPLVWGYQNFDKDVTISGVILNRRRCPGPDVRACVSGCRATRRSGSTIQMILRHSGRQGQD